MILLTSIGLIPTIVLTVLAVAIGLLLLWWILNIVPPIKAYASTVVLIVAGIIALLIVVGLLTGKAVF